MKYTNIFNEIRTTSKIKAKEQILKEGMDSGLEKILNLTFNPYINYYIKKYNKSSVSGSIDISTKEGLLYVEEALKKISSRAITGGKAIAFVENIREGLEAESQDVFDKIISRDLKIGINESTINKVVPNLIPTFDVALANTFDPERHQKLLDTTACRISRKCDGLRLVAMNRDGVWTFWSRQGKPFNTLDVLKLDLEKNISEKNIVLDGELCLVDENGDEDFAGIMKVARKKDEQIKNPRYQAFDILSLSEFESGTSTDILSTRYERLKQLTKTCTCVVPLEQVEYTEKNYADLLQKSQELNWEGLILRFDVPYKSGRSNDLLKVKAFKDFETKIIDMEVGDLTFALNGHGSQTVRCVSSLKIAYKGNIVSVGSGLTREERIYYMDHPQEIIGKVATIKYFSESVDSKTGLFSLRFPTVRVIHGDRREF